MLFLAASLLCHCPRGDVKADDVKAWLTSRNADADMLACFDLALADPSPLHGLLDQMIELEVTAYGYVAVLAASDMRIKASLRYLEFLQARFDLPTSLVRSATRRFQR